MATRSRTASRAQSPFDSGHLEPQLPPTSSVEYGKVSLERVTRLLLGLLGQVERLEREVAEIKEAGIETRTNVEKISQAVNVVKDVEETPRPIPKIEPIGLVSREPFWAGPSREIPGLAQPTPRRAAPPRVPSPPLSPHLRSPIGAPATLPPAPAAHYPAPVKDAGLDPPQRANVPTDQEVLSFLLMNMKDTAGLGPTLTSTSSGHTGPLSKRAAERKITTLTQSGTCADYITKFRTLAMELDWNDAALRGQFARGLHWEVSRQIATRKHRPAHSSSCKMQHSSLTTLSAKSVLAIRQRIISLADNPTPQGGRVPANQAPVRRNSPMIPTLYRRKNAIAAAPLAPASNAAKWAINSRSAARVGRLPLLKTKGRPRKPPKLAKNLDPNWEKIKGTCCRAQGPKDSGCIEICNISSSSNRISPLFTISIKPEKQADPLEVLIDSGATSSFLHPHTAELLRLPLIDLPQPRTVTMLDGSSPQAGKIWKKAVLTFSFDGKKMTETFLICNTGSHAAILGLKWLDAHNPEIDWNSRTLSFPHSPPEHVAIAEERKPTRTLLKEYPRIPSIRQEEGPLNSPLYSMTDAESATLKDWLRDELKAGKIRPSKSSISSPVMFVPKKDGSRRLVVDYRRLNNRTKKNVYPLPRPDDLMAQLRGAKVFTKLDLRWGYNNVQVKEGDEWKTAFRTKYGLYESLVMTFGLTNAPAAFQHFMNELFKDLLDVCVIIYLDDILIYSKDDATHNQHVHKVLRRLMENQLFCKASKCTFHVTSVEYLGIVVSDKGFSLDKLKIQAVQNGRYPPKSRKSSFLGFANFLRRFVANFSHMARPLHNLVKKDTPWKWDTKEQEAFQGLKDAITNAPVLCHANPTKPYFLETDASGAALGSILSQRQEDGCLHPLGFLSESFKGAEQNYDTHDKELLAIIRSFEYWRIFLEGTAYPITVFTDHRNLEYWKESRTFNRRHARWHLLLAGYNFQIVYRPGKQSGKPDALSRRSDHANIPPDAQTMHPDLVFANVALVTPEKELQRQIELSLDQDESLEEILQFLQNESKAPPSIKRAFKDYEMEAGLLFYQGRIVVPDVGTLRTELLRIFHDSPLAGHPGRQRTLELVSHSCETCQRIRKPKYASIPPQPLELPVRPWQHVSYDMIVDLPKDGNNDSILVIVDSFTKYGIFIKCSKKLKAPELAELFLEHGRVFNNKFLRALYKRLGIDPHFSSAYHPQSNGQTERVNPSIEHFLRAYVGANQRDWTRWLPMAEFAYNNAVHSSTGKTPFKALYGWEPTLTPSNVPTDVPEADDLAQTMETQWKEVESALRQSKQRMTAGEEGSPIEFEIGEEAWLDAKNVNLKTLSPKLTEQRLGPFKRQEARLENRPPPVTVDGEEEYEVEGITDAEERNGKWFFRVKWKGYGSEENTWEPEKT
ncbi:Chromo (CHRromatin Organization MOdifier) domain [Rhizoctonia solani]|uniref:Chromo (CHRromatin Organization MOdifier) domain n=1 Tax=Rhizoctonia solani TaxID=456999 RepID=A0A8H7M7Z0_9AGAM|nr:Chromo (CHRromatin Organization MOdifier) domain [Rhizoctonia solani]